MIRKLIGLVFLFAVASMVLTQFEDGQANALDRRESAAKATLESQYKGLETDHIRFGPWNTITLTVSTSDLQNIERELAAIEQETVSIAEEKQQTAATLSQWEQPIRAVEADFSAGKLTREDADMLIKMFREKTDKLRQSEVNFKQRLTRLETRKQELLLRKEPQIIEYAQVEFDRGIKTFKQTVFYNSSQERLMTEKEINGIPQLAVLNEKYEPVLSTRVIKQTASTAGFASLACLLIYGWRRSTMRSILA
ncbi:hypothetical protein EDD64_1404 [Effusibacillus lacus]|nr:hypothetical protein EDD64_1404 [Effusibacillus lacus]